MNEDPQLAQRIQRGERAAFTELYRRYAPALLRRLVRMIGDRQHAEDCLQKVFMKAYHKHAHFRGDSSLHTWLYTIATHTVTDHYRKQSRLKGLWERLTEKNAMPLGDAPHIPDAWFAREETRQLVWEILEDLSPHKRMALVLCELEGHSLDEAAQMMEVPIGTMASRVYHGRRDFHKLARSRLSRRGLSQGELLDG